MIQAPSRVRARADLVELLFDPHYIDASRRMVGPGRIEGVEPEGVRVSVEAVSEQAGDAVRAAIDPAAQKALAVIERAEASMPDAGDRVEFAERIEAFTDRCGFRYWELVAIINGWPDGRRAANSGTADAWEWYAQALRAHA